MRSLIRQYKLYIVDTYALTHLYRNLYLNTIGPGCNGDRRISLSDRSHYTEGRDTHDLFVFTFKIKMPCIQILSALRNYQPGRTSGHIEFQSAICRHIRCISINSLHSA